MGWQDWVPVVGPASKGDFLGAGADVLTGGLYTPGKSALKTGYDYFYGDPANNVKAAYDQAMGYSQASGQKIKDFLMGQQQQALGYYAPVQHKYDAAYGTQGIQGPMIPKAPMGGMR